MHEYEFIRLRVSEDPKPKSNFLPSNPFNFPILRLEILAKAGSSPRCGFFHPRLIVSIILAVLSKLTHASDAALASFLLRDNLSFVRGENYISSLVKYELFRESW